ncbi:Uncharacterised protein [Klebsiella pneumoniae]|uniref:Uncharacterized protein n=1 Tax=Klebsiella pneumoniae TaxID=573 RepID=A0A377XPL1_KLEPN|nr:Uncharacterised protein [Klebsiella pneumoniae]
MSGKEYTIQPKFMSATSILIPPDNTQAMITFYSHEFTHAPANTNAEGQMQNKSRLGSSGINYYDPKSGHPFWLSH